MSASRSCSCSSDGSSHDVPSHSIARSTGVAMRATVLADHAADISGRPLMKRTLVTAQPDGTFTAEFDPEPVRAKQASGWVPVDTTLETTSSGELAPKAAAADITFSGGGTRAPLARIKQDGKTYSVSSPWTLPAPTLSG